MKLNIFLTLATFCVSTAVAQQATCDFANRFVGGVFVYTCGLSIVNPDGLEITEIDGIHWANSTDADVRGFIRINGTTATPWPAVFCTRFPNMQRMTIVNGGVTAITDDSFGGCTQLTWLSLLGNNISSISVGAFTNNPDLTYIDLDRNRLSTLPENVFANQGSMTILDIRSNPFTDIPPGAFNGLSALTTLHMQSTGITAINPAWFASTGNLRALYVGYNRLNSLTAGSFATLSQLVTLSLYNNSIGTFDADIFVGLTSLRTLDIGENGLTDIEPSTFVGLENLSELYLMGNNFRILRNGTFRVLTNLTDLNLARTGIRELESGAFEGLAGLEWLSLNFNQIEDLPEGIFVPLPSMVYLGLWDNSIKVMNRHYFGGNVSAISTIDLDGNVVNALERSLFDDAVNLNLLYFSNNLCANGVFTGFIVNRVQFLERLERCFRNFELIVEAVTDSNDNYSFFTARHPGLVARVQAGGEIQIALTPFNLPWAPMLEIIIGANGNTRSLIRRNQSEDVAVVPTPGILRSDSLNLFRVVWANHVVLVFRDNEQWPFLVYTMVDFFNVNFYGLRSPQSRATWSVQPIDF